MTNNIILRGIISTACLIMCACQSPQKKSNLIDRPKTTLPKSEALLDSKEARFEKGIYLKIDAIHTGEVYTTKDGKDVFYRILEIPEEENTMLIVEKISMGEEGGNYQLVKRIQLTNPASEVSTYGFNKVDSIKFIDSVSIQEYFDGKKRLVNLDSIK